MSKDEDEYAAAESYILLVGDEIDAVISGAILHKSSSYGDVSHYLEQSDVGHDPISSRSQLELRDRERLSPFKDFQRTDHCERKLGKDFESRKAAICFGIGITDSLIIDSDQKGIVYKDKNHVGASRITKKDEEAKIIRGDETTEAFKEGKQRDVLLERLLEKQRITRDKENASEITERDSVGTKPSSERRWGSDRRKKDPKTTDLQALLDYDRDSLLMGSKSNSKVEEQRSAKASLQETKDGKNCTKLHNHRRNLKQVHQCYHPHHHHKHYHHGDQHNQHSTETILHYQQPRQHMKQRPPLSPHQQHQQRYPFKDPSDEMRKKTRAERLAQIYEDVKKITRTPPSPENETPPTPSHTTTDFTVPSHVPPHVRGRGFSDSDAHPDENFENRNSLSRKSDSYLENTSGKTSLESFFDGHVHHQNVIRKKDNNMTRKSYPNGDSVIIAPPPGFDSSSSGDEQQLVEVGIVSKREDDDRNGLHLPLPSNNANKDSTEQQSGIPFQLETVTLPKDVEKSFKDTLDTLLYSPSEHEISRTQKGYGKGGKINSNEVRKHQDAESSVELPKGNWSKALLKDGVECFQESPPYKLDISKMGQDRSGTNSKNQMTLHASNPEVFVPHQTTNEFDSCTKTNENSKVKNAKSSTPTLGDSAQASRTDIRHKLRSTSSDNSSPDNDVTSHDSDIHERMLEDVLENSMTPLKERTGIGVTTTTGVLGNGSDVNSIKEDQDLQALLMSLEDNNNNNTDASNKSALIPPSTKCAETQIKQPSEDSGFSSARSTSSIRKTRKQYFDTKFVGNKDASPLLRSSDEENSNLPGSHSNSSITRTLNSTSKEAAAQYDSLTHTCPTGSRDPEDVSVITGSNLQSDVRRHAKGNVMKTKLKDTAIQTSLELDGYAVDISENLASQGRTVRRRSGHKESEEKKESYKDQKICESIPIEEVMGERPKKDSKEYIKSKCSEIGKKTETKKDKVRRPSKTSMQRSKSLHNGDEEEDNKSQKSDAPSLSGSLRELSHLNIDVSQRLVDGERRFVVDNGSPELQVVVNALTPVLSRRSRGRNARRLGQTDICDTGDGHKVKQNKGTKAGNVTEELKISNTSKDTAQRNERARKESSDALPMFARLCSYDGPYNKGSGDPCSPKEIMSKQLVRTRERKELYQISDQLSLMSKTDENWSTNTTRTGNKIASVPTDFLTTDLHLDLANGDDDLSEELEKSKKSLFLSPKLSHTWHGASDASHRTAPRMGVGVAMREAAKLFVGPDSKLKPVALLPTSCSSSSQSYHHAAQTLPVISRTLLDAMHKRYCAHQYSNQLQTLQPFSLLRIDPTSSLRNQPITALRLEPGPAREHEVQAAPPSPQVMARLRKLNSDGESDTGSSATDSVQSSPRQPHQLEQSNVPIQPPLNESCAQVSHTVQPQHLSSSQDTSQTQQQLDRHSSAETPESSPRLRERLSHGSKQQAELEAVEALKWLRAAGFPQYAQMFEDGLFPLELTVVEKDHDFLDKDSLKSLFRRLETLNKYAGMKIDAHPRKKAASEEDDEDDLCALSERWEYQKSVRRWSRKDLNLSPQQNSPGDEAGLVARTGSHDSLLADQDSGSQTEDSPLLNSKMPHRDDDAPGTMVQHHRTHELQGGTGNRIEAGTDKSDGQVVSPLSPRLRRVASERIKTAKNLWKKMEGLKSKKSRRHPNQRNIVEISGPVVADRENMQAKLQRLNCVDISPTGESLPSPPLAGVKDTGSTEEQGVVAVDARLNSSEKPMSPTSPQSLQSPTSPRSDTELSFQDSALRSRLAPASQSLRARPTFTTHPQAQSNAHSEHDSSLDEYYSAQNQLLMTLQAAQRREANTVIKNNSDTNLMEIFLLPQDHQPGRFPRMLQNGYIETEACGTAVNPRTGSVRLGRDAGAPADHHRVEDRVNQQVPARSLGNRFSVYDNFLPTDGRKVPGGGTRSVIPGVIELDSKSSRNNENTPSGTAKDSMGVTRSGSSKDRNVSFDSSTLENIRESRDSSVASNPESVTRRENGSSCRERSVSFESSSSHSLQGGTTGSERGITSSSDSRTSSSSRKSSTDSSSFNSRGVSHSASVESYFTEPGNGSGTISSSSDNTSSSTLQQDYDEFDLILQQLYDNINDLNKYMEKDEDERPPPTQVNISTTPTPKPQTPLDLVACDTLPRSQQPAFDLESPNSPASDLLVSPTSQLSPNVADESLDLDGVTFPDNENSSSGGEGSHTAESGSDDQEVVLTDLSHDDSLDQIQEVSRERRDSGVGHSLTRAPSDRRRKKIRWHSFQRCHRPDVTSRAMQINSLTVGQLVRLQKLSLLKLTGIMEKCLPVNKSGWNWMMPRFMKRHKAPDFSDKNVFGVPLSVMAQRTGQPLPQCVLYAMRYLRRTSQNAVGIFRKSGVKSKIQQLRDYLEEHPDTTDFEGMNAYNIADMLKTFFRDLPECLLTNKMSETFRSIYTHVPLSQRLEAIQAAILLLPDENREVLQSILLFLSDISTHEADHQMNASNLAVCFTPTVFQLGTRQLAQHSPKRSRKNSPGIPDPREILEQKAAHECLLMMIQESKRLFTVPSNMFRQLQVPSLAHMEPTPLQDIGSSESEVRAFGQERIQMVLKEAHDKNRGWVQAMTVNDVEVYHRKPMDECPLKEWKHVVDIEAPPIEVLRRLMHERHAWDEDLLSWSVVERLDPHSDIFQYVLNSMAPHPSRHYCVLRYWRSDLNKGACALITMSVDHSDATEVQGVWAVDLGSYFLMEPCGSGRSRLTYITRVDSRGRTPEWYTKIFGHLCANFLDRLRDSFKQAASGPETKV